MRDVLGMGIIATRMSNLVLAELVDYEWNVYHRCGKVFVINFQTRQQTVHEGMGQM